MDKQTILETYNHFNEFGRTHGMDYTILSPGNIEYSLNATPALMATRTAMHGGAMAGFVDAVLGVAALSASCEEGKVVSTVEYKLNFLAPVILNDQLKGVGRVISKGNRIIVAEAKIYNQREELVAIASGTFNAYPFEKSDMYNAL